MDSLVKAVSSIKDRITKTPLERSLHEICSDENWGAPNTLLHEISEKTFSHEERGVIMKNVWELLKSPPKEWRRLYKVLNLLEHLLKFGSPACMNEIQDEIYKIRILQDFSYREGNEEKGIGVRDKSRYLGSLLSDKVLLEEEREKARKTWSKFTGISSESQVGKYESYTREPVRSDRGNNEFVNSFEQKPPQDIFRPPEIRPAVPVKSIWDSQPSKLIPAPRTNKTIPILPQGNKPSFDPPVVKKNMSETIDILGFDTVPIQRNLSEKIDHDIWDSGLVLPCKTASEKIEPSTNSLLDGFTFNPSPVFPTINTSASHINHSNSMPSHLFNTVQQPKEEKTQVKIHANIGDYSGATMEQMKIYGKSQFTPFQSAPPVKKPADLESKLFNLDDLEAGQPKAKEIPKSRW